MTMANRRWTVALGTLAALLLVACGNGDRTGFNVPVNAEAIETAGSAALPADLEWANLEAGNVVFSHGVHMVFADNCDVCHEENQPWGMGKSPHGTIQMAPMYRGESCGVCHDGDKAFDATDCSRCHAFDSASNTLPTFTWNQNGFGPVEFSHSMHLMAGSQCNQCHPAPWGWTISPAGTMRMTPMYKGGSCGVCHDGVAAFDATSCSDCHDRDLAKKLEQRDGVTVHRGEEVPADFSWAGGGEGAVMFGHANHIVSGLECDRCHFDVFERKKSPDETHLMNTMYAEGSCGACHNGRISFASTDCGACHEGALNPAEAAVKKAAEAPAPPPEAEEG